MENREELMLTERDFVPIAKYDRTKLRCHTKHHMTRPVFTAVSSASFLEVVNLMRKKHVHHLPVSDKRHKLVDIISSRDLMNAAMEIMLPSPR